MPSNPYDAKGLLISAIEDDDPVIFFEPKRIYNGPFDGDPNKPAVPWTHIRRAKSPRVTTRCRSGVLRLYAKAVMSPCCVTAPWYMSAKRPRLAADVDAEIIDIRSTGCHWMWTPSAPR